MSEPDKRRKLLCFAYAVFLGFWLIAAFSELARMQADGELFFLSRDGLPYISDFVNHYKAGAMVWTEDRLRVYDPQVQQQWTNRLISPHKLDTIFYLQYPPFIFPLLAPLAALPMGAAFWLWCVLFTAASLAGVIALLGLNETLTPGQRRLFCLGYLASLPVWLSWRLGQFSLLLVALFALFCKSLRSRHDIAGGAALALSTLKPQYAPFFLMAALMQRKWRLLLWSAVFELALLVLAGATVGWDNVLRYPDVLRHAETSSTFTGVAPEKMVNLRGAVALAAPALPALPVTILLLVTGLVVTVWLWRRLTMELKGSWAWGMAATVLVALLFAPHVHAQDLALLVIPAALTLPTLNLFTAITLSPAWLRWWCGGMILFPLLSWAFFLLNPLFAFVRVQPFVLLEALLLVSASILARHDAANAPGNP